MTAGERLLAAAIFASTLAEVLLRAIWWTLVAVAIVAGVLVLCLIGMSRGVQRIERGTRPW